MSTKNRTQIRLMQITGSYKTVQTEAGDITPARYITDRKAGLAGDVLLSEVAEASGSLSSILSDIASSIGRIVGLSGSDENSMGGTFMGRSAGQLIHTGANVVLTSLADSDGGCIILSGSGASSMSSSWTIGGGAGLSFIQGCNNGVEYPRIAWEGGPTSGSITLNTANGAIFKTILGDSSPTLIMSASQSTGLFNIRGGESGQLSLNDSGDSPRVVIYPSTAPKLVLSGNGVDTAAGIRMVLSGGSNETYECFQATSEGVGLISSASNLTLYASASTYGTTGTIKFSDQWCVNNTSWGGSTSGHVKLSKSDAEWTTLESTFGSNKSLISMLATAATTTSPPTSTMAGLWLVTGRIVSGTALAFESQITANSYWNTADSTYGGNQIGKAGNYGIPAGVTTANYTKVIDAYVNGNLLVSGSTVKVGVAAADYHLGTYAGGTGLPLYPSGSITFGFDLENNDTVLLKVR